MLRGETASLLGHGHGHGRRLQAASVARALVNVGRGKKGLI